VTPSYCGNGRSRRLRETVAKRSGEDGLVMIPTDYDNVSPRTLSTSVDTGPG
jgi:hypothetical protein